MIHSETIGKLTGALMAAQAKMPKLGLNKTNPHFKSKYADLHAITEVVQPTLLAEGLTYTQLLGGDGNVIEVTTVLLHSSGEWMGSTLVLPLDRSGGPQGAGSAITYGRRYGLAAIVGLVADEDDDGNAAQPKTETTPKAPKDPSKPISEKQLKWIMGEISKRDVDRDGFCRYFKIKHESELTMGDFQKALDMVKKKPLLDDPSMDLPFSSTND